MKETSGTSENELFAKCFPMFSLTSCRQVCQSGLPSRALCFFYLCARRLGEAHSGNEASGVLGVVLWEVI